MAAKVLVDGVKNSDRHEGARFGATLALPLNRYQSIKLHGRPGIMPIAITISI
mgnify:CR=1 FL=1